MDEYEYFRKRTSRFQPKTPMAALKAYRAGFLPSSVFTYKSGSAKPLDEVPYDIEEIDKMKNGSYKAPVISPWLSNDGEAACTLIISHIICLSRCQ